MFMLKKIELMRRTKVDAKKTKELIVKAAIKEMSEKGYSSTRLSDIAKRANVTRGAIYHYYENKSAILYDIHTKNKERVNSMLLAFESKLESPIEKMKNIYMDIFNRFEEDEEFRQIEELFFKIEFATIIKEDNELRSRFNKDIQDYQKRIIRIVKTAQKEGYFRSDISAKNISLTIISFYFGLTMLWFTNIIEFSIKKQAKDYIEVLFKGLEAN
ncbi:MAG: hypothetical protein CR986_07320 [Ignavibacteriae bacterium]|nr:MAG: hypothetical protein CR986_07320 [Ignavibacteriota bacterium]